MNIVGRYSFNQGEEYIKEKYPHLLEEIETIISQVDADRFKTKRSKEKTMPGRMLYNPRTLNIRFDKLFAQKGWIKKRIPCKYPEDYYVSGYKPKVFHKGAFREMDFIKEKLGVEIQFGKYAFMVYNVCAKMTIFKNAGFIDAGVEVVPIKEFADEMSTGVSYFEQFLWDLDKRGVADIDIPVLILGINRSS